MDYVTVLAVAAENGSEVSNETTPPVEAMWELVTGMGLMEALMFIAFGSVCLFYGWRVFKVLVVIAFALLGMAAGTMAVSKISGFDNRVAAGAIGMGLMAALAIPLMRHAVAILGAAAGGAMTAGLWYACNLTDKYIWAGALIGVIAGGMISFIVFKIAVILFTSMGGSGLMMVGMLALLYLYPLTSEEITSLVNEKRWFVPVAFIAPTILGIIIQNKLVKTHKEWDL